MNMRDASDLASTVLNGDTPYAIQKRNISYFFDNIITMSDYRTLLQIRLALIDGYYSTNMSKRLYGIQDLAENIIQVADNDYELSGKFEQFIENGNDEIHGIFKANYGITRNGNDAQLRAISIITKFAYYLTNYKFPIYDSIVRKYLIEIIKKDPHDNAVLFLDNETRITNRLLNEDFFKIMNSVNIKSHIENYDKLDNLCWLYGKMKDGSYSLILKAKEYAEFMGFINDIRENHGHANFNASLTHILQQRRDELKRILNNDNLILFMDYVFGVVQAD